MAIQHYSGIYGESDYDDTQFELAPRTRVLHYIGKEIYGSNIEIPKGVTGCPYMFAQCFNLKTPPVIPDNIETCEGMFYGCLSLQSTPFIPDTVTNCQKMFKDCLHLENPPIIPENVRDCREMFMCCTSLKQPPIVPQKVKETDNMFLYCGKIMEEAGLDNIKHRGEQRLYNHYSDYTDVMLQCYPRDIYESLRDDVHFFKLAYDAAFDYLQADKHKNLHKQLIDGIVSGSFTNAREFFHEKKILSKFIAKSNHEPVKSFDDKINDIRQMLDIQQEFGN